MSTGSGRRRLKKKRSTSLDPSAPLKRIKEKPKNPRPTIKKKKKNARRRAVSNAPSKPEIATSSLSLELDLDLNATETTNQKRKKTKKYSSKTPRPTHSNKKKRTHKSSVTPEASSSSTVQSSMFSSDDELNSYDFFNGHTKTTKETDKNIKKLDINMYFNQFRRALNEQQYKLLHDLESTEEKEYELIIDKHEILSQIKQFGSVQSRTTHTNNNSVIIHSDIDNELKSDDAMDSNPKMETMAMKKKLILGQIQQKTMDKLDMIILMEKEANAKSKQADALRQEVDEGLKYITERRKIINDKIAIATPELRKAKLAVSGIDPRDINEIKTLKSPPTVIEKVITATVMILGHKIKQWRDVQKLLSYKFKPQLMNFDTYTLTKATRQKVYQRYAGKEDFTFQRVYAASKVCGNLVLWVLSQINYSRMLDVIIPLEKEVKKLKRKSEKKEKLMKELIRIVKELEVNIELYTTECDQMIDHIIKSTDDELKQFSEKLQPLNKKFNQLLKKCM